MNREDFPLIMGAVNDMADCCMGKDMGWKVKPEGLVYLDNAATMQKPRQVIRAVQGFYETANANPLRGMYDLAVGATEVVDEVRKKVARFIGGSSADEVIFTSGATEGLNMAAEWSVGGSRARSGGFESDFGGGGFGLSADDEILVGIGEHHSNLLPWARAAGQTGAKLRLVNVNEDGAIDEKDFLAKLTPNTKVVAVQLIGNVLGNENDVKRLFKAAHGQSGAICVLDAAQAVAHVLVDARGLGADILAFSGHKIGAPMGIGVLWAKRELLEKMEPLEVGGGMVESVKINRDGVDVERAKIPQRFEAGTLNVGGIVGLGAAIDYLESVGMGEIERHEEELTDYAVAALEGVSGVEIYGAGKGIIALNISEVHPHDTAAILNEEGIAVRAGWHCAQPLLEFLEIGPVVRVSMSFYNTKEEIDKLVRALAMARGRMGL